MSSRIYLTELSTTCSPWPDLDFGQLTMLSGPVRRKFATVYDAAILPWQLLHSVVRLVSSS